MKPVQRRIRMTSRGSLVLGLAGLIVVLTVLCASVLLRSMEAYRSSAFHAWRLQALAAAEGAGILLQQHPEAPLENLVIGDARVSRGAAEPGGTVPLHVKVMRGDQAVYTTAYRARFAPPTGPGGSWQLTRLEAIPQ